MPQEKILYSIIVCTCDKEAALSVSMMSLLAIHLVHGEIIVVDNGKSGMSADFVLTLKSGFSDHGITFTYVRETNPGLSNARNTGARRAAGTFLLYLDDDCIPVSELLDEYARAIELFPNTGIAGGTIVPRWQDDSPPDWLPSDLTWVFGEIRYSSDAVRILKGTEKVNGGNFLIRKDYMFELGGFDPLLGNIGNSFGGAEEQDLLHRARSEARKDLICVPSAVVRHDFPMDRLSRSSVGLRLYQASYDRFRLDLKRGRFVEIAARLVLYSIKWFAQFKSIRRNEYKGYIDAMVDSLKLGTGNA